MPYFKDSQNKIYFLDDGVDHTAWLKDAVPVKDEAELATLRSDKVPGASKIKLTMAALSALVKCDAVGLRCWKSSVPFPPEWLAYDVALRAIANGTDTSATVLPAQPAYPAGT